MDIIHRRTNKSTDWCFWLQKTIRGKISGYIAEKITCKNKTLSHKLFEYFRGYKVVGLLTRFRGVPHGWGSSIRNLWWEWGLSKNLCGQNSVPFNRLAYLPNKTLDTGGESGTRRHSRFCPVSTASKPSSDSLWYKNMVQSTYYGLISFAHTQRLLCTP